MARSRRRRTVRFLPPRLSGRDALCAVLAYTWSNALTDLRPVSREQVEKLRGEWQVCFEDWREQIAGDQCSKCGFQHYGTSINHYKFCPACGAPTTDEAVEMVMEREEALKDVGF